MGIPGAELNIVADHQNGYAAPQQHVQNPGESLLELRIQPLGRLVHQQDLRVEQEHLGQRRALLLAAGQVVGMPVEQLAQPAQCHDMGYLGFLLVPRQLFALQDLKQVFAHGLFNKQRLRVLRQDAHPAMRAYRAPVRLQEPREQLQAGGFARAVAAE